MNNKKTKVSIGIIIGILSVYLSMIFTNIISPKVQVYADLANYDSDQSVQMFLYDREYRGIYPDESGKYLFNTEIYGKEFIISFEVEDKQIVDCMVNDKSFVDIDKISNYTTSYAYVDTFCFKINEYSQRHYMILILLSSMFIVIGYFISKEIFKQGKYSGALTYSNSSIRSIGKKPIIISIIIVLMSSVFYYGCDLNVISESIIMYQKGIDFYQLFACLNKYKNLQLYMWQYDGAMLAGYNLVSYIFYPLLAIFDPTTYHWVQAIGYKVINMLLCNLTVLSVISYLLDNEYITNSKARKIYYWSIFNPMIFYVAFIFIQFDVLPIYCITIGLLLLQDIKSNKVLAAFIIAFGISTKMTMWMFIPILLVLLLYMLLKEKKEVVKEILKFGIISSVVVAIMLLIPRITRTPVAVAYKGMQQAQRIWYTSFCDGKIKL